jgi:ComF family protein
MFNWRLAFEDLQHLFYPRVCRLCDAALMRQEDELCLNCLYALPRTRSTLQQDNPVAKVFFGRVKLDYAGAYLFFRHDSMVQKLLHQIKYRNKKELAVAIGKLYALELLDANFERPDVVVPVPLHPRKERQRGYNQSYHFAMGLSAVFESACRDDVLIRTTNTATQTRRSRWNRWENVATVFDIKNTHEIAGKRVMLVDDVTTTGATLEACVRKLQAKGAGSVGVLTIAFAVRT